MRDPKFEAAFAEALQQIKDCLNTHPWVLQPGQWRARATEEEVRHLLQQLPDGPEWDSTHALIIKHRKPKRGRHHEDFLPRDLFLASLVERALAHRLPAIRNKYSTDPALKKGAPCAAGVVAAALKAAGLSGPGIDRIEALWEKHRRDLDGKYDAALAQLTGLARRLYIGPKRNRVSLAGKVGVSVDPAVIPRHEEE